MTLRNVCAWLVSAGLSASALAAAGDPLQFRGVNGEALALFAPKGKASAMFFVASDCPISNWYAPTIQQACRDYAARGVDCRHQPRSTPLCARICVSIAMTR